MVIFAVDTRWKIGYIYQEKTKFADERGITNMKSTGIVRKVDELGRIVLPMELRRVLDIKIKDSLEITAEDDKIVLKKYEPCCVFCSSKEELQSFKGRCVCKKCLDEICAK